MNNAVFYDPDLVRYANLPKKLEAFLLKKGLPLIESADAVLGVHFQSFVDMGLLYAGERKLLPIGYEWEPESTKGFPFVVSLREEFIDSFETLEDAEDFCDEEKPEFYKED
ncbi:hypothetical protein YDYSY3_38290 [Paenibacillus chitinolyticus]|uniref:hypothetical protein n=1 Tax=Paenibacillus chitinolyticus TaxID=79263 RepID=UPI0026E4E40A|nr:hypothetical protein [Paenibacillus chitinolyticus]GKS12829.1 hypothetical protein YDYSY3_38290 [Paenibacillus chitinolyticus]